jgi:hypothetical protein
MPISTSIGEELPTGERFLWVPIRLSHFVELTDECCAATGPKEEFFVWPASR